MHPYTYHDQYGLHILVEDSDDQGSWVEMEILITKEDIKKLLENKDAEPTVAIESSNSL